MNSAFATLFNMMYPVGSIYMSATLSNASAVNNALPGTWQAWGAGRVPVGVDTGQTEFNTVGKTGGEKTHTLTTSEMPSHNHSTSGNLGYDSSIGCSRTKVSTSGGDRYAFVGDGTSSASSSGLAFNPATNSNGSGKAHNNLQPYITCYMYKRVS
jgi:microcystin-dependent protein